MHRPSPLDRDFFARSTVEVARALVGCRLVYEHADGVRRAGTIVETEAYPADDPAWRSWGVFDPVAERVRPEGRALDFFGRPGTAYLYRIHVYWLLNVVTEPEGVAGGVLIRAVAPEEGVHVMWARRPAARHEAGLAAGPGRLCQAFDLDRRHHGADLTRPPLYLAQGAPPPAVVATPRVGVRFGRDLPYRFVVPGHPCVTPVRHGNRVRS